MGRQVYQESHYKVYRAGNDYIVHHSKYDFEEKHTHLRSLNVAKQVISCLLKQSMPKTRNEYVLTSIIRLTDNPKYKNRIQNVIDVRRQKGKKQDYYNHATA